MHVEVDLPARIAFDEPADVGYVADPVRRARAGGWGRSGESAVLVDLFIALTIGVVFAYPINWWLVTHHTKHGMLTVREKSVGSHEGHGGHTGHGMSGA